MPVDLGRVQYGLYQRSLAEAQRRMANGDLAGAAASYRQCAEALKKYANYAATARLKRDRLERARAFEELAAKIESGQYRARATTAEEQPGGGVQPEDYESEIAGLIFRSPITWNDIGGLEATKAEIKSAYGMSVAQKPPGVRLRGWRNILFYGPPGTGKTLLAAATSNGLDATFFNVKVSNLLSKYFGESSKLISALYSLAKKMAPSVVFLDEIESISGERGSGDSGAERRIVSTFLAELDGVTSKADDRYVLTIAATNLPWLLDQAILSRFEKKIYVPLPDQKAREAILRIQIEGAGHKTKVPISQLAELTEGYSGREIERLCAQAIQHMVAEQNPSLIHEVDKGKEAVERYQIQVRPLAKADFDYAFSRILPETDRARLALYAEWEKQHGT